MDISIGLTGWGDHDSLYLDRESNRNKLASYSSHFPVVEIDTAFYAIQPQANYVKWVKETPENFSFVIKVFKSITGHDRLSLNNQKAKDLVEAFKESIQPVLSAGKLNAVLFQFPPWFDLNQNNIRKLKKIKSWMDDLPVAIEFRNRSWFLPSFKSDTLDFLTEEGWIHTICDEPQAGDGSIPVVLKATHPEKTLIRFHGRNVHGWNRNGRDDWREVRFLYKYNEQELLEWVNFVYQLQEETKHITVLFNNNSGGDAANNAKQFMKLLNITYSNLNPMQLDMFDF
ncbi:DUF72 domain-containing protein [Aquibacillus kalidii]|uniref:DUF72 domain-containing protein n=1 Tax=Aquibacillus kalidii TaxID=2762597 RepID=UPI001645CF7B|nr:DUF72 domain-containing protein [Aquibacillus kalidii]